MDKASLRVEAIELGIDVDNRWSAETLFEKIAEKRATSAPPARDGMVNVVVLRDYWTDKIVNDDNERVRAGTIVSVPVADALRGFEQGRFGSVK